MAAQVNDPYVTQPDPATTDLSASNFGSAFSSPGSLSSTNLSLPSSNNDFSALNDPNYFTSSSAGAPPMSGAPAPITAPPLTTGATPAASSGSNWWSGLGSTLGNLAPSLITGGIGLSQARGAQKQSDAFAAQLTALGGPYTAAGQQLLRQFQSGQIRPDQRNVANLATSQGQTLIDSGTGLSAIAQAAYQNYQAGKLPPADEQRLADQTAAQKQEMRQRLSQQGIVDSSILAGYDQQIENQANINRQDLLDKRFATGNQAYDQWLKSTTEGQALKLEGAQFASTALDQMLNESLALGAEGMGPITQAIQLQLEQNAALSGQVNQLMGNLASAYAYQHGHRGGSAGDMLKTIVGDASTAKSAYSAGQAALGALGGGTEAGALGSPFAASGAGSAAGTIGMTDATAGLSAELGAAPAAVDIAGGEAAAGSAAGATGGADAAAGGSAGAAGAAGAAAGVGLLAAPLVAGLMTPSVALDAQYWSNLTKQLQQPTGSYEQTAAALELSSMLSQDPNSVPADLRQMAAQMGITPINTWNLGPTAGAGGGLKNNIGKF